MKNNLITIILSLSFFLPISVFAVEVGKVDRIYPHNDGVVYFTLKGNSCGERYFSFGGTSERGKLWYSLLLMSASSQQTVKVQVPGGSAACKAGQINNISYIYVDF